MRILVVEDDDRVARGLVTALRNRVSARLSRSRTGFLLGRTSWPGPDGHGRRDEQGHDPRELGPEPRRSSPFPLWAGIVPTALFLLPVALFGLIGVMLSPANGEAAPMSPGELTFALAFSIVIQLGLFAVAIIPLLAKGWFGRPLWGTARPTAWVVGIAVGVVATIGAYIVMTILGLVFAPEAPVEQQIMEDALRGGAPAVLAIIVAVVIAPITEEVIFRGALFRSLRGAMGMWPAAIVSSLVFAVIHIEVVLSQPLALSGLFLLGVAFAIALQRTGSLIVPILAHAVFNATSIGLALVAERFEGLVQVVPSGVLLLGG
jgi:membrane protease YdiL (CAAX protease family)